MRRARDDRQRQDLGRRHATGARRGRTRRRRELRETHQHLVPAAQHPVQPLEPDDSIVRPSLIYRPEIRSPLRGLRTNTATGRIIRRRTRGSCRDTHRANGHSKARNNRRDPAGCACRPVRACRRSDWILSFFVPFRDPASDLPVFVSRDDDGAVSGVAVRAAFSVARDGCGSVTALSWNTGAGASGGVAAVAVGACPFWVFSCGAGSDRLGTGRERVSAACRAVASVGLKRRRDRRRGYRLRFAGCRFRGRRVLPLAARRRRAVLRAAPPLSGAGCACSGPGRYTGLIGSCATAVDAHAAAPRSTPTPSQRDHRRSTPVQPPSGPTPWARRDRSPGFYDRMNPSSSFAAQSIACSAERPCTTCCAIILVIVPCANICVAMRTGAGAPEIDTITSPRGG